jgi:hypothetical protein
MRFPKAILTAAAMGACVCLGQTSSDNLLLQIFAPDRSLRAWPLPVDPAKVSALDNSDIGKAYYSIRPARSVLIYDCGKTSPWCNAPAFSFSTIFREAAKIANPAQPDPAGLALAWYISARGLDTTLVNVIPRFTLATPTFQLLAIANRMDMAHFEGGQWQGAEIHFIYGLIPTDPATAPRLTVIMEFKLPRFNRNEFQKLAATWSDLSKIGDSEYATRYPNALANALRQTGFSPDEQSPSRFLSLNSRLNHIRTAGPWMLSQLVLDPASSNSAARRAFAPDGLNDQIDRHKLDLPEYRNLWRSSPTSAETGLLHFPVPGVLAAGPSMEYEKPTSGLGPPSGVCDAPAARNILALQQCTWCHTTETNTRFTHIPNRLANEASTPSEFLIGPGTKGANIQPRLADLYYAKKEVVWRFDLKYKTFTGTPNCTTAADVTIPRAFHDVARRTLFLAAAQKDQLQSDGKPKAGVFSAHFTE